MDWRIKGSNPDRRFFLLRNFHASLMTHSAFSLMGAGFFFGGGVNRREVILITHFYVVLILRMNGAILPPPIRLYGVDRGKFPFIFYCMPHCKQAVTNT
jgi:hypothetical protein